MYIVCALAELHAYSEAPVLLCPPKADESLNLGLLAGLDATRDG